MIIFNLEGTRNTAGPSEICVCGTLLSRPAQQGYLNTVDLICSDQIHYIP